MTLNPKRVIVIGMPRFSPEHMSKSQTRSFGRLRAAHGKRNSLLRMLKAADDEMVKAVRDGAASGIPHSVIAAETGYTEARIWQLVNDYKRAKGKENA